MSEDTTACPGKRPLPDNNAGNQESATPTMESTGIPTKPNPFRERLKASLSPDKFPETPECSDTGAFNYDFDQGIVDQSPTPAGIGRRKSAFPVFASDAKRAQKTKLDLGNVRRASKIPRMSPMATTSATGSYGGSENRRKSDSFSPGTKSGIPVPTRFLPNKPEESEEFQSPEAKPENTEDTEDTQTALPDTEDTDESDKAEIQTAETVPMIKVAGQTEPDLEKAEEKASDNVEILPGGVRVKRLTGKRNGPTLRICPEAEKIIMGDEDGETEKPVDSHSGARKSIRLSTDSFKAGLTKKRTSRIPAKTAAHPSPSDGTKAGKAILKSKNGERANATPPSAQRSLQKPSPSKALPATPTKRSTNPYSNVYEHSKAPEHSSSLRKTADNGSNQRQGMTVKPVVNTSDNEGTNHGEGATTSPQKSVRYRTPETKEKNQQVNSQSPKKGPRTGVRVSRRASHRQSNERMARSRSNRDMAATARAPDGTNTTTEPGRRGGFDLLSKRRRPSTFRESRGSELTTKPKSTSTRGVLQNFRGLFTKNKADGPKMVSNGLLQEQGSHKLKSRASTNFPSSVSQLLNRSTSQMFGDGGAETMSNYDPTPGPSTRTIRPVYSLSRLSETPAMSDTASVSNLTMEILEAARLEPNTSKKEKLIRIGKVLIKAVNYSHDAEKSMLTAFEAAKEAEVSCAMAKENALRLGQVVREWSDAELHGSPT